MFLACDMPRNIRVSTYMCRSASYTVFYTVSIGLWRVRFLCVARMGLFRRCNPKVSLSGAIHDYEFASVQGLHTFES